MKRYFFMLVLLMLLQGVALAQTQYDLTWSDGSQVVVISRKASIWEKESISSKRLASVPKDTIMKLKGEYDQMYAVETPDGTEGFVRKRFVTRNFGYIVFHQPVYIRSMPFDDAAILTDATQVVRKQFLVVGKYNEDWLKLKIGDGVGFVRIRNCCPYEEYMTHQSYEKSFYIITYGKFFIKTDPYRQSNTDGECIGEQTDRVYQCIGRWGDTYVVKYGEGVAFVPEHVNIVTQWEVEAYMQRTPKYVYVGEQGAELKCRNTKGEAIVTFLPDTRLTVLGEEMREDGRTWYVVPYEEDGYPSIGWVLSDSTISEEDYLK